VHLACDAVHRYLVLCTATISGAKLAKATETEAFDPIMRTLGIAQRGLSPCQALRPAL
jgi:hypothetical protein